MSRPGLVKVDPTTAWNKPQSLRNNLKVLSQEIVQILSYILKTVQILTSSSTEHTTQEWAIFSLFFKVIMDVSSVQKEEDTGR